MKQLKIFVAVKFAYSYLVLLRADKVIVRLLPNSPRPSKVTPEH